MAQNVKWRWMSKFSFLFFVSLYLWLLFTGSAIAQDTRSPASVLTEAVEKAKPLTRGEFLSLLVTEFPFDAGLLMRGLGSGDPLARKLAAVQLGEIGPDRINSQVMAALINGVRDLDEGVAKQLSHLSYELGGLHLTFSFLSSPTRHHCVNSRTTPWKQTAKELLKLRSQI